MSTIPGLDQAQRNYDERPAPDPSEHDAIDDEDGFVDDEPEEQYDRFQDVQDWEHERRDDRETEAAWHDLSVGVWL